MLDGRWRIEWWMIGGRSIWWMLDGRSVLCTKSQIRPCAKVFSIPQKFFHFVRIQHADIADICQILFCGADANYFENLQSFLAKGLLHLIVDEVQFRVAG